MILIRQDVNLLPYNTFGIPATAASFVECDDASELVDFFRSHSQSSSCLILGGGSNMLFASDHCDCIVHPAIKGIELIDQTDEEILIRVGAGEVWDDLVKWCVEKNYAGLENLSAIPGMVGACPIQNIGAYGVEAKDVIEHVEAIEVVTGKELVFNNKQCNFGYRDSFFKRNKGKYLITAVQFRLSKNFIPNVKYADIQMELARVPIVSIDVVRKAITDIRSKKLPDPSELGNAGSFFKNPTITTEKSTEINQLYNNSVPLYPVSSNSWKISAGWLIQQCGWKGVREGNVGTHKRQALVIVNYGGATGTEILDFAQKIIDSVNEKFGIRLEPEVNVV